MASKEISSPAQLMEMANAFRVSRLILTAHELRIFDFLREGGRTSSEIARLLGTHPRATDRLMNALVAIGLLQKSEQVFSNTGFSARYLVTGSPAYLMGMSHLTHLWRTWNTLTHCVAAGTTVTMEKEINDRPEDWRESFIAAMHSRAGQQAIEVAKVLDLPDHGTMLDVGGGSGVFSFAFIAHKPDLKAVVFDLPNILPFTKKYILNAGMETSVTTMEGNYLTDSLGEGFALTFMSAIIHINDPAENELLIRNGADSLVSGGQLVILDHFMDESRTEPAAGALFALNMLVGTDHGDTYTEEEVRLWMEKAGLEGIRKRETPDGTTLMIGNKP